MDEQEIFEEFDTVASEMATDASGMVTVRPEILAAVTDGDDDPRFATFVIESGWSKQKRYWGPELFGQVVSEMNTAAESDPIVGYMGHIKPDDHGFAFPEIQLQWVGAKMLQTGDKARMAVKAYVLPGTKAREYLKRGLVKTVSWRGLMSGTPYMKGERVEKFQIESIDLSRPRAAGMSARLAGALTSEMEERSDTVKPEEIAALQANELRAHNPGLVETIEGEARKPLETKVSEMEAAATAVKPTLDLLPQLRTILGLKDDSDEISVVQAAMTKLKSEAKSLRDGILDKVLDKRFKGGDENDKSLVRRILVGEMESRDVKLTGNSEDDEKAVSEMVTTIIDGDDSLKKVVSEMESAPADLPTTEQDDRNSTKEWKPGMSTTNVRVKARV
jgi:hypothetical protein